MLKHRKFRKNEDGFIGAALLLIVLMLVLIWFISSITANIIPLAIILVLGIVLALIVKNVLAPSYDLDIIRGATGLTKEAGRAGIELYESAKGEFKRRRK